MKMRLKLCLSSLFFSDRSRFDLNYHISGMRPRHFDFQSPPPCSSSTEISGADTRRPTGLQNSGHERQAILLSTQWRGWAPALIHIQYGARCSCKRWRLLSNSLVKHSLPLQGAAKLSWPLTRRVKPCGPRVTHVAPPGLVKPVNWRKTGRVRICKNSVLEMLMFWTVN